MVCLVVPSDSTLKAVPSNPQLAPKTPHKLAATKTPTKTEPNIKPCLQHLFVWGKL